MLDRLMGVGGECSCWLAGLPVEVDGGAEGEDAGGDAADETGGGFGEVVFEPELVFECLDDRFDPLADEAERWLRPGGLVGAAGADDHGAELVDGVFEVAAGEAFVAEDELAVQWLAGEQGEAGFAFRCRRAGRVASPRRSGSVRASSRSRTRAKARCGSRSAGFGRREVVSCRAAAACRGSRAARS